MTVQDLYNELELLIKDGKGEYAVTNDDGYNRVDRICVFNASQTIELV